MIDIIEKVEEIEKMVWEVAEPRKVIAERAGVSVHTLARMLDRRTMPTLHIVAKLHHTLRRMVAEKAKESQNAA